MASASLLSADGAPIRGTLRRWGPLTLCMFSCTIIMQENMHSFRIRVEESHVPVSNICPS